MRLADPWNSSSEYSKPLWDKKRQVWDVKWQGQMIPCYALSTGALVPMNPIRNLFKELLGGQNGVH